MLNAAAKFLETADARQASGQFKHGIDQRPWVDAPLKAWTSMVGTMPVRFQIEADPASATAVYLTVCDVTPGWTGPGETHWHDASTQAEAVDFAETDGLALVEALTAKLDVQNRIAALLDSLGFKPEAPQGLGGSAN